MRLTSRGRQAVLLITASVFFAIAFIFAGLLFYVSVADAASCSFSWLPNSESNLAGYKIHYGTEPGVYTVVTDLGLPATVDGRVFATLPMCVAGKGFYFACTAYTADEKSDFSNEVYWPGFALPVIISAEKL